MVMPAENRSGLLGLDSLQMSVILYMEQLIHFLVVKVPGPGVEIRVAADTNGM